MTRLYFSSGDIWAEVDGSEFHWLHHVARGPGRAAWDLRADPAHIRRIMQMIPLVPAERRTADLHRVYSRVLAAERAQAEKDQRPAGYSLDYDIGPLRELTSMLEHELCSSVSDGLRLHAGGRQLMSGPVCLNTALRAGSAPVALAAKLAAFAELHCWVEGPERRWLADVILQGLDAGIFRWQVKGRDQGWVQVMNLLRIEDETPVVLSYSVSDDFPNDKLCRGLTVPWEEAPRDQQWEAGMETIRSERWWMRLHPTLLHKAPIGPFVTVYDLLHPDVEQRVAEAFAAMSGDGEPLWLL